MMLKLFLPALSQYNLNCFFLARIICVGYLLEMFALRYMMNYIIHHSLYNSKVYMMNFFII